MGEATALHESRAVAISDEALVRRTLAGDIGAFETLVERHRRVVYRVAARIVGEAEAEDVAQDAFLRAFHRLSRFRAEASFRSWLLRITHNAALDSLARRRAEPLETVEEQEETLPASGARSPADQLEIDEKRDRLASKLRLMQPVHRSVLVLRDLEGLSYEEIAHVTGSPLGSVKGRLHRARRELIELLRANAYDWELPQ